MVGNLKMRKALLLTGTCIAMAAALAPSGVAAQTASPSTATPAPAPAPGTPASAPVATAARPTIALGGTVQPKWGNIRTFWGDSSPFWGNIRTFWGDVNPYAGDTTAFWGNIRTFNDGTTSGSLAPLWGNIRTFSGDLGASWGNIRTFWGNIRTFSDAPQDYTTLSGQIQQMVNQSQTFWGSAVQAQTGKSFSDAFASPLVAKYGIDLSNPQSLEKLDVDMREHFFMDWYDGLMNYSGADHVDHWMNEINWTPALTQTLGSGRSTVIGLLDFSVTGDTTQNIIKYSGVSTFANGHGSAVASLMVAAHDGKGVMGIAPSASVVSYNPFDATQTAGWADIKTGVLMLAKNNASVINASLGVPGWTLNSGWNDILADKAIRDATKSALFVLAAGNDGSSQSQSITWNKDNAYVIVVGSVDPNRTISAFSNQPGTACLLDGTTCKGDYLKNHFIVAPGELILVDDGKGGVTRLSGTSFAAPLVSGTIALIQDRWPWLTDHPKDVAGIILNSATDLGTPGIDPVYGVGELNVLAALSPLDFARLTWKQSVNGRISDITPTQLRATTSTQRSLWETNSVYFAGFEKTGESFRDFEIPLSSKLANQTVSVAGSAEQFMSYLTSRFTGWLGTPASFTGLNTRDNFASFTDLRPNSVAVGGFGDAAATLSMRAAVTRPGFARTGVPVETALRITSSDEHLSLAFGNGAGAAMIDGHGFGMTSDYDPAQGGANPLLGLASGGAFGHVELTLAPGLTVASSVTQRSLQRNLDGMSLAARQAVGQYDPYRATAANMTIGYRLSDAVHTSLGYTMLHEGNALLGTESVDRGDLRDGSSTDAATLGADVALAPTFAVAATATVGRTRAGDAAQTGIAVGRGGLVSTAFEVAMSKNHLLDRRDRLRLSMAQPMHVESGSIAYTMVKVVDRNTGELGTVTQNLAINALDRHYVAEAIYGRTFLNGAGEVSLFGKVNFGAASTPDSVPLTVGSSLRVAF